VEWAGDWSEDPGDLEILGRADREHRVLVTLDKDFAERARGICRHYYETVNNISAKKQADMCIHIIERYKEAIEKGAIITVEANRVRIRPSR
jgi:predicted nuclease of predicted toxin-antitoxin system